MTRTVRSSRASQYSALRGFAREIEHGPIAPCERLAFSVEAKSNLLGSDLRFAIEAFVDGDLALRFRCLRVGWRPAVFFHLLGVAYPRVSTPWRNPQHPGGFHESDQERDPSRTR